MSISAVAVIKTTTTIIKYGEQVITYIRDDLTAKLGLLAPVRIVIEGPGVGIGDFKSPDRLFSMISPTINRVDFNIQPFPADKKSWWNGPDGIPNDWSVGVLCGSLVHDPTCEFIKAIAAELDLTEDEVWEWASGILATITDYYGGSNTRSSAESWLAYNITRNVRKPYQWLRRRLGFVSVIIATLLITGCSGCLKLPPDWRVSHADPIIWVEGGVTITNTPPAIIN